MRSFGFRVSGFGFGCVERVVVITQSRRDAECAERDEEVVGFGQFKVFECLSY